jgi:hypothetical protein
MIARAASTLCNLYCATECLRVKTTECQGSRITYLKTAWGKLCK